MRVPPPTHHWRVATTSQKCSDTEWEGLLTWGIMRPVVLTVPHPCNYYYYLMNNPGASPASVCACTHTHTEYGCLVTFSSTVRCTSRPSFPLFSRVQIFNPFISIGGKSRRIPAFCHNTRSLGKTFLGSKRATVIIHIEILSVRGYSFEIEQL